MFRLSVFSAVILAIGSVSNAAATRADADQRLKEARCSAAFADAARTKAVDQYVVLAGAYFTATKTQAMIDKWAGIKAYMDAGHAGYFAGVADYAKAGEAYRQGLWPVAELYAAAAIADYDLASQDYADVLPLMKDLRQLLGLPDPAP